MRRVLLFSGLFLGFLLVSCSQPPAQESLVPAGDFGARGVAIGAEADPGGVGGDVAYGLAVDDAGGVYLWGRGCDTGLPLCTDEDHWVAVVWAFSPEGYPKRGFGNTGGRGALVVDNLAGGGPPNAFMDAAWRGGHLALVGVGKSASNDYDTVVFPIDALGNPVTQEIVTVANLREANEDDVAFAFLDAGDRFWLAGGVRLPSVGAYRAAVFRMMADGGADPTFAGGGPFVDEPLGDTSVMLDLVPAPDGGIVSGGTRRERFLPLPYLWRVELKGVLEGDFGDAGRVLLAIPEGYDRGEVMRLALHEGGVLAAGYVSNGGDDHLALWRVGWDGALAPRFGEGGLVVVEGRAPASVFEHNIGLAVDEKARVWLVGGLVGDRGDTDMAVWRFLPDGTLDPHFCGGGPCTFDNAAGGYGDDWGTSIAFGPEGVVYVGGWSWDGGSRDAVVWKLLRRR